MNDLLDHDDVDAIGQVAHALARELWSLPRSISGAGLRATLQRLGTGLPDFRLIEVPSGTRVLDWIVPEEWEVHGAWIERPDGQRICDFSVDPLHLVGYSIGLDTELELSDLQPHLHSLPDQPDAIPYVTSYYQRRWGFCLPHRERVGLPPGRYRVRIDARHFAGSITLAECLLPGTEAREILLSSYCCHPSMANNELSGPVLLHLLGRWLAARPRRLGVRLLLLPEMIGSVAWLSLRLDEVRGRIHAGYNLSCLGDEREWGYLPSRAGDTAADRVARHVLGTIEPGYRRWRWADRGSDESNYCAPGVDLPVATLTRSKYGSYPEYHTSLDDLQRVVTPKGLGQSYAMLREVLTLLDAGVDTVRPRITVLGEPQLGRRGLYPSLSVKGSTAGVRPLLDLLSMADGKHSLLEIAEACGHPVRTLLEGMVALRGSDLLDSGVSGPSAPTCTAGPDATSAFARPASA